MAWAVLGAAIGAVVAALPLVAPIPGETFERVSHSLAGGTGEKSIWMEPLSYLVVLVVVSAFSWNGGLLGASAAAATGLAISWLRPQWRRIGLAAATGALVAVGAAVFVQFGPYSFRIVEVKSRAEPAEYTGPCPVNVKVTGSVTAARGAGEVRYQFMGPTVTPAAKLVFDAPGTREVATVWTIGEAKAQSQRGERWRLIVRDPRRSCQVHSDGTFTIRCTK